MAYEMVKKWRIYRLVDQRAVRITSRPSLQEPSCRLPVARFVHVTRFCTRKFSHRLTARSFKTLDVCQISRAARDQQRLTPSGSVLRALFGVHKLQKRNSMQLDFALKSCFIITSRLTRRNCLRRKRERFVNISSLVTCQFRRRLNSECGKQRCAESARAFLGQLCRYIFRRASPFPPYQPAANLVSRSKRLMKSIWDGEGHKSLAKLRSNGHVDEDQL